MRIKIQDLTCHVPPIGKVRDHYTGKYVSRPILKRSDDPAEQYWERPGLPNNWNKMRALEKARQIIDPTYVDVELEEFRRREWDRRLNGVWFMNNGKPEYLTPLHYFYLAWWKIDSGYPDFRKNDWEYFVFLDEVIRDPQSAGLAEVTKRRAGKTARSGAFIYEYVSRTKNAYGGAQSKTDDDVRENVFSKFIVQPFKHLPDFFRPIYDTSKGITPTSELRFFHATKRGSLAEESLGEDELESVISYKSSKNKAYDGSKLHRYVSDESAKLPSEHDVYERHEVVKLCAEENGEIIGKLLYTTTVEEMGGKDEKGRSMKMGGVKFKELYKASDQRKRTENGRTQSWLYQFFVPAYKTIFFDKYGYPDQKKAIAYYMAERKAVEHDPRRLNSVIRKAPFTIEEAFRADSDSCLFNAMNLNNRLDFFSYANPNSLYTRGNLHEDENGNVTFKPSENGRFKIHELPDKENNFRRAGSMLKPNSLSDYIIGIDPYSHSKVNFGTGSLGAAYVYKRLSVTDPENTGKFVAQYLSRPPTVNIFFADMRKLCKFYGAPMLFESQKQGIKTNFEDNKMEHFMLWMPGAKQPGIPSSTPSKQELAETTELYIEDHIDKVPFKELVDDWIDFDLNDTEKYDAAMAAGWTLVGDKMLSKRFKNKKLDGQTLGLSKAFRRRKAGVL